jgi:LmbE family N-acetylglucosaminyl deacetylase
MQSSSSGPESPRRGPRHSAVVVSPHLDDAVLSCGEFIAANHDCVVVTVFAGEPSEGTHTEWDRRCGLTSGAVAVQTRREEDRKAIARLAATPVHLPFLDDQYRERPDPQLEVRVAGALGAVVEALSPGVVVMPLGLGHRDHRLTRDACLSVAARRPAQRWCAYAEAMYRREARDVRRSIALLEAAGFELEVQPVDDARLDDKVSAAEHYRSQLRGLESVGQPVRDIGDSDRVWRLRRRAQP